MSSTTRRDWAGTMSDHVGKHGDTLLRLWLETRQTRRKPTIKGNLSRETKGKTFEKPRTISPHRLCQMCGGVVADARGCRNRVGVPAHGRGRGEHAAVVQAAESVTAWNGVRSGVIRMARTALTSGSRTEPRTRQMTLCSADWLRLKRWSESELRLPSTRNEDRHSASSFVEQVRLQAKRFEVPVTESK